MVAPCIRSSADEAIAPLFARLGHKSRSAEILRQRHGPTPSDRKRQLDRRSLKEAAKRGAKATSLLRRDTRGSARYTTLADTSGPF